MGRIFLFRLDSAKLSLLEERTEFTASLRAGRCVRRPGEAASLVQGRSASTMNSAPLV